MASEPVDTRERIFEAADELFCQSGYDGVSVRDVARRAEVNKASVFYYFSSKEELFEAVLKEYYRVHREALAGALTEEGSVGDRMHHLVDDYWAFMQENVRYSKLVHGLLTGDAERVELVKPTLAPLFSWTVDLLAEVCPADGPMSARQMYLTFSGAVVHYFSYAPALESGWGGDPLSEACLDERLAHLHWLVDLVLDKLDELDELGA